MRKLRLRVIVSFFALIFLLGFPVMPSDVDIIVPSKNENYITALKNTNPDIKISTTHLPSAIRSFEDGDNVASYNTSAVPLLNESYTFTPHYRQTIIIAIDRDMTNAQIEGFSDLVNSTLPINFDFSNMIAPNMWEYPQTHQIVLSMSNALYGEYDVDAVAEVIKSLDEQRRFFVGDTSQPVTITYDSTAVDLIKKGENLEIIIPNDGTLSFDYGELSYMGNTIYTENLDDVLIDSGYRLPDGRADERFYPAKEEYENVGEITDYEEYSAATSLVAKTLRRDSFNTRIFGFTNQKESVAFYLLLLCLSILYMISLMRRITSAKIRGAAVNICILVILYITLSCIKGITSNSPVIETFIWYCYYIPTLLIPAMFVYIAINTENNVSGKNLDKFYKIYLGLSFFYLILIFTNNFHQMVFIITNYVTTEFTYNFAYYIIMGTIYISVFLSLGVLIYKSFQSPKKKAFLMPTITLIVSLCYTCARVIGMQFAREFDVAFGFSIMIMLAIEACMQSRLFPNNKGYNKLFSDSSLMMEIRDFSENIVASSSTAKVMNDNFTLVKNSIAGGTFLYYEDYTTLNTASEKLSKLNSELERNNLLLKDKAKVNEELSALRAEKEVYGNIDVVLNEETQKIAKILSQIETSEDKKWLIGRINIIICKIKRVCMLLISAMYKKDQPISNFVNNITEMKEFAEAAGLKITIGNIKTGNIDTDKLLKMYRIFCLVVERAAAKKCSDIVVQLYDTGEETVFSVIPDKEVLKEGELKEIAQKFSLEDALIKIKPWDNTQSILLSFARQYHAEEARYD